MKKKIKNKNISPHGWWCATIIERFEYENEDYLNLKRRCKAWTNTIILKAKDHEEAYKKAMEYGELGIDGSYEEKWI